MRNLSTMIDLPLNVLFLGYVGLIGAAVAAILMRYLPLGRALGGVTLVAIWLTYAGIVSYSGIVGDPTRRPPGIFLLVAPILVFSVLVIGRSPVGPYLASRIPLAAIMLFQTFRVGVELTLSSLHDAGLASRLLTLPGGNFEMLIALSAPLIALLYALGAVGRRMTLIWNVIGLFSLLNVAMRAVLTSPDPLNFIQSDVPSVAMGMYPFGLIPGFMAPLAVMLHLLALRALRAPQTSKLSAVSH